MQVHWKFVKKIIYLFLIVIILYQPLAFARAAIQVLAAENVYGNVVKELGGAYVNVTSILNNPSQDPHLFQIKPSIVKLATDANFIIYNGADYDPWMQTLLTPDALKNKKIIEVAKLANIKPGDNPHIWYSPKVMLLFADYITPLLIQMDPEHRVFYQQQLKKFKDKYQLIFKTINQLKSKYQNTNVIATEPIFNYMTDSIGLKMHGLSFQMNIMNGIPPTITQIKQFEDDLTTHSVKVFIYNNQVINSLTKHMLLLAQKNQIPIVGINETMPNNINYIEWILAELAKLKLALSQGFKHE